MQFAALFRLIVAANELKEFVVSFKVGVHMVGDLLKLFAANSDFPMIKDVDVMVFEKVDNKAFKRTEVRANNTEYVVSHLQVQLSLCVNVFWINVSPD